MQTRYSQTSLFHFASLLIGRRTDYALQRPNGRYVRVGQPVSYDALQRHLEGTQTMGTYVLDEQGTCAFAVFDADTPDGLATLAALRSRLACDDITSYLEQSRRGGHLWVFLTDRVPASLVRSWLLPYCPAGVEFYPKQDTTDGYGSLIRVPLGVHRLSGFCYPFVTWEPARVRPVASGVAQTVDWLMSRERVVVPVEQLVVAGSRQVRRRDTHTSMTSAVSMSRSTRPSSIAAWCATQDPIAVIGRYVRLDRRGLGCCPFGEHHHSGRDRHPSLRVYQPARPGGACWHCYTWGQGGSVFDFLARYHGLDARTLWARMCAGESF